MAVRLADAGVRSAIVEDGPLGGRIREAHRLRIPLIAIVGAREIAAEEIVLRHHGAGNRAVKPLPEAVAMLADEVAHRRSHGEVAG